MHVGRGLRKVREVMKLSAEELAARAGVDPRLLEDVEGLADLDVGLLDPGERAVERSACLTACAGALGVPRELIMLFGADPGDLRVPHEVGEVLGAELLDLLLDKRARAEADRARAELRRLEATGKASRPLADPANLPAEAYTDPSRFVTPYDRKGSQLAEDQYAKGKRTSEQAVRVTISELGTWGAELPDGSSLTSWEVIGYHAQTADLLRGFLDGPAPLVVHRRGSVPVEVKSPTFLEEG